MLHPQIGGKDADWEVALDPVATKFQSAIQHHGPDSVAFYVSGQLLTEDYNVANKLMKGFIGSANINTNSLHVESNQGRVLLRALITDKIPQF